MKMEFTSNDLLLGLFEGRSVLSDYYEHKEDSHIFTNIQLILHRIKTDRDYLFYLDDELQSQISDESKVNPCIKYYDFSDGRDQIVQFHHNGHPLVESAERSLNSLLVDVVAELRRVAENIPNVSETALTDDDVLRIIQPMIGKNRIRERHSLSGMGPATTLDIYLAYSDLLYRSDQQIREFSYNEILGLIALVLFFQAKMEKGCKANELMRCVQLAITDALLHIMQDPEQIKQMENAIAEYERIEGNRDNSKGGAKLGGKTTGDKNTQEADVKRLALYKRAVKLVLENSGMTYGEIYQQLGGKEGTEYEDSTYRKHMRNFRTDLTSGVELHGDDVEQIADYILIAMRGRANFEQD